MNIPEYIKQNYLLTRTYTGEYELADVTRRDLAKLLHKLDLKKGVEVGVAAGIYGEILLHHNPQMELYFVDPWKPYGLYRDYTRKQTFERLMSEAEARFKPFPNAHIVRTTSVEAAKQFEDESLDFVFIDANHQEKFVTEDINAWYPKVRPGGILSGHDYANLRGRDGVDSDNWRVIPAVQKFIKQHNYDLYIWGLNAKIPKLKRDSSRSWMICK
jgi:predicted O-methyltransferase YrrM